MMQVRMQKMSSDEPDADETIHEDELDEVTDDDDGVLEED